MLRLKIQFEFEYPHIEQNKSTTYASYLRTCKSRIPAS
jgi:hypothetical protein